MFSDGASSTYHASECIVTTPTIGRQHGINIRGWNFFESQAPLLLLRAACATDSLFVCNLTLKSLKLSPKSMHAHEAVHFSFYFSGLMEIGLRVSSWKDGGGCSGARVRFWRNLLQACTWAWNQLCWPFFGFLPTYEEPRGLQSANFSVLDKNPFFVAKFSFFPVSCQFLAHSRLLLPTPVQHHRS